MTKRFTNISIDITAILEKDAKQYENIENLWESIQNLKYMQQQAYTDMVGDGINTEINIIVREDLKKSERLLKIWGEKNEKNSKESGTIQKDRNKNKKNKYKPNN